MSFLNERSKRQIALLAGDDLEGEQVGEAQRNIDLCSDCRQHWIHVRGCLDVLDRAGKTTWPQDSRLWPAIESRLRSTVTPARPQEFNGWVPALSMAAACIALLIAGRLDGIAPHDVVAPGHDAVQAGLFPSGYRLHSRPISDSVGMKSRFDRFQRAVPLPRIEAAAYDAVLLKPNVLHRSAGPLLAP